MVAMTLQHTGLMEDDFMVAMALQHTGLVVDAEKRHALCMVSAWSRHGQSIV